MIGQQIPTKINGIPTSVRATHFYYQPPFRGSAWLCDSDVDYYGQTEIDFDILNDPDDILASEMTDADRERIEGEILDVYRRGEWRL